MRYLLAAVLAFASSTGWVLQSQQTSTGSITGRVVDKTNGAPVVDAIVSYSVDGNRTRVSVQSDANGRFVMKGVPSGRLFINGAKDGYVPCSDHWFDLTAGEDFTGLDICLQQYATLSGQVTDDQGEGIFGAEVSLHRLAVIAGRISLANGRKVRTDREGKYLIDKISPASYVVTAAFGDSSGMAAGGAGVGARQRSLDHPRLYYPNSLTSAAASVLDVGSGEAKMHIDFRQRTLQAVSVSGRIVGLPRYPGSPTPHVELRPADDSNALRDDLSTVTTAGSLDGEFSFRRVPPGRYVASVLQFPQLAPDSRGLILQTSAPTGFGGTFPSDDNRLPLRPMPEVPTLVGEVSVTVGDQPVDDIVLQVNPAASIAGRILFKGSSARPAVPSPRDVAYVWSGINQISAYFQAPHLADDFSFRTSGLPPGPYSLMFQSAQANRNRAADDWTMKWRIQSVSMAGKRLPGALIELGTADAEVIVTMSDVYSRLQGGVRDAAGKDRPDATIYIVQADRRLWTAGARGLQQRADRWGRFDVELSPGDYLVVASASAPDLWTEVSRLDRLMRNATRVHIGDGERIRQDLGLADAR